MTIGSLFSGIGGIELGLESCGLGPECHVCWTCDLFDCPGASDPLSCPDHIVSIEEWTHDVSVEEGFSE